MWPSHLKLPFLRLPFSSTPIFRSPELYTGYTVLNPGITRVHETYDYVFPSNFLPSDQTCAESLLAHLAVTGINTGILTYLVYNS